jgi:hypothetical protein
LNIFDVLYHYLSWNCGTIFKTRVHDHYPSWLGSITAVKSDGVKLVWSIIHGNIILSNESLLLKKKEDLWIYLTYYIIIFHEIVLNKMSIVNLNIIADKILLNVTYFLHVVPFGNIIWGNQFLLLLLIASCLTEKQQVLIL